VIRGVITCGTAWRFVIVTNASTSYAASEVFNVDEDAAHPSDGVDGVVRINQRDCTDLIAGALTFWLRHSFEGLTNDD